MRVTLYPAVAMHFCHVLKVGAFQICEVAGEGGSERARGEGTRFSSSGERDISRAGAILLRQIALHAVMQQQQQRAVWPFRCLPSNFSSGEDLSKQDRNTFQPGM